MCMRHRPTSAYFVHKTDCSKQLYASNYTLWTTTICFSRMAQFGGHSAAALLCQARACNVLIRATSTLLNWIAIGLACACKQNEICVWTCICMCTAAETERESVFCIVPSLTGVEYRSLTNYNFRYVFSLVARKKISKVTQFYYTKLFFIERWNN